MAMRKAGVHLLCCPLPKGNFYCWVSHKRTLVLEQSLLLIVRHSDELVSVLVVLHTRGKEEGALKPCLSRLVITLEAYATGIPYASGTANAQTGFAPLASELLHSETIKGSEESYLIVSESTADEANEDDRRVCAVWPVQVPLGMSGVNSFL